MKPIDGMSLLITGGGSGIGAGAAEHLAGRGARVTIPGRRPDRVEEVAARLGDRGRAVTGDVTAAADRTAMIEAAVTHGGGLDALISNAGNMYRSPVDELDEQALLDVFHANVVAGMMATSCRSVSTFHQGMTISGISSGPDSMATMDLRSMRVPTMLPSTNTRSISEGSG